MSAARQLILLMKSHVAGDDTQFRTLARQIAAKEARAGHTKIASEIIEILEQKSHREDTSTSLSIVSRNIDLPAELQNLVSYSYPEETLKKLVLPDELSKKLRRTVQEQKSWNILVHHNLQPRQKLLLVGPPGSGKTLTAHALAGELRWPLFTILLEGVITKYMGESAQRLKLIFDSMSRNPGIYLFDEFDAIGVKRTANNDVGEVRRILNSFLQLLENFKSRSIIIAATNHPELLDSALFRRFDDVLQYGPPDDETMLKILQDYMVFFDTPSVDWQEIVHYSKGLSQAELAWVAREAAKTAILNDRKAIETSDLRSAIDERKRMDFQVD